MRSTFLLAVLALAWTGLTADASAASRLRFVGPIVGSGVSDGQRYYVYQPARGSLRVIDRSKLVAWTIPTGGCSLLNDNLLSTATPGQFALQCSQGYPSPAGTDYVVTLRFIGLAARTLSPPRDFHIRIANADGIEIEGVGRRWLRFAFYGYHSYGPIYVNRATGRQAPEPPSARSAPDLDAVELARQLCAPMFRTLDNTFGTFGFFSFAYDQRFGMTTSGRNMSTLRLQHCAARSRVIYQGNANTTGGPRSVQLASGLVTWIGDDRAFAYAPHTQRRWSWLRAPLDGLVSAAHTRHDIFVVVANPRRAPIRIGLFMAPLPPTLTSGR